MNNLKLPEILNVPEKLLPFILNFDKYNYHLQEGGRGGGKSHGVGRFLSYIAEQRCVRICCGRETQKSIDESVKQIIKNSLLLAITNLPTTILFAVVTAGVCFAWYYEQIITFSILIFMGFGIIALLFSFFLKRIFEKHGAVITPDEEIVG